MLNKLAWVGVCMLDLINKFHYDYIKNIYVNNSRLLFTDNDNMKLKLKMYIKVLVRRKRCLILAIILFSQSIAV